FRIGGRRRRVGTLRRLVERLRGEKGNGANLDCERSRRRPRYILAGPLHVGRPLAARDLRGRPRLGSPGLRNRNRASRPRPRHDHSAASVPWPGAQAWAPRTLPGLTAEAAYVSAADCDSFSAACAALASALGIDSAEQLTALAVGAGWIWAAAAHAFLAAA